MDIEQHTCCVEDGRLHLLPADLVADPIVPPVVQWRIAGSFAKLNFRHVLVSMLTVAAVGTMLLHSPASYSAGVPGGRGALYDHESPNSKRFKHRSLGDILAPVKDRYTDASMDRYTDVEIYDPDALLALPLRELRDNYTVTFRVEKESESCSRAAHLQVQGDTCRLLVTVTASPNPRPCHATTTPVAELPKLVSPESSTTGGGAGWSTERARGDAAGPWSSTSWGWSTERARGDGV